MGFYCSIHLRCFVTAWLWLFGCTCTISNLFRVFSASSLNRWSWVTGVQSVVASRSSVSTLSWITSSKQSTKRIGFHLVARSLTNLQSHKREFRICWSASRVKCHVMMHSDSLCKLKTFGKSEERMRLCTFTLRMYSACFSCLMQGSFCVVYGSKDQSGLGSEMGILGSFCSCKASSPTPA